MKNAMKKLTSLLLVAVLLVGALPFAASAATFDASIDVDGVNVCVTNGTSINYNDCASFVGEDRVITKIVYEGEAVDGTQTLSAGQSVTLEGVTRFFVFTEAKSAEPQPTIYNLSIDVNGVQKVLTNGTYTSYEECLAAAGIDTNKVNVTEAVYQYTAADGRVPNYDFGPGDKIILTADTRVYFFTEAKTQNQQPTQQPTQQPSGNGSLKDPNKVILNIFVNKDFNNCKTVDLSNHWVVSDNKITHSEILNYVVTDYYKAVDTNKGLVSDGLLYYTTGSYMYNWLYDANGVTEINNLDVMRANQTVTVNIMVTNAAVKSKTAAADTSNPKTGDSIYTAMTVMGLSAVSLAAVMFFYNKKRYTV